jgi:hypothetical protein
MTQMEQKSKHCLKELQKKHTRIYTFVILTQWHKITIPDESNTSRH